MCVIFFLIDLKYFSIDLPSVQIFLASENIMASHPGGSEAIASAAWIRTGCLGDGNKMMVALLTIINHH